MKKYYVIAAFEEYENDTRFHEVEAESLTSAIESARKIFPKKNYSLAIFDSPPLLQEIIVN
jgi:hypothetical protein